jgi:regulation of enolase protein 1 (concanavalin A-like superfamily)
VLRQPFGSRNTAIVTARSVLWNQGTWTTEPNAARHIGSSLVVEALEGSDFWQRTLYGFDHDNGHALLAPFDRHHGAEVEFELASLTALYDQAGLMLRAGPDRWIKAGVEITDGVAHIGSVVTHQSSDWSLSPVPDWLGGTVTVRASQKNDSVVIRARREEQPWRTIRVAPLFGDQPPWRGHSCVRPPDPDSK